MNTNDIYEVTDAISTMRLEEPYAYQMDAYLVSTCTPNDDRGIPVPNINDSFRRRVFELVERHRVAQGKFLEQEAAVAAKKATTPPRIKRATKRKVTSSVRSKRTLNQKLKLEQKELNLTPAPKHNLYNITRTAQLFTSTYTHMYYEHPVLCTAHLCESNAFLQEMVSQWGYANELHLAEWRSFSSLPNTPEFESSAEYREAYTMLTRTFRHRLVYQTIIEEYCYDHKCPQCDK